MLSIIAFLIKIALLEKEIKILKRRNQKKQMLKFSDRIIFSVLNILYNIKDSISIFKPDTILKWQRSLIKSVWSFKHSTRELVQIAVRNAALLRPGQKIKVFIGTKKIFLTIQTIFHTKIQCKASQRVFGKLKKYQFEIGRAHV